MVRPKPRPFVLYPHRCLSTPAAPVAAVDDTVRALWDEMLVAMYDMPGVGLAAPQLGVGLRVIVVDAGPDPKNAIRLANPELTEISDETVTWTEGSPNMPGLSADVVRANRVTLTGLGPDGPEEHKLESLWAISAQHQIDHLNGKLYIDRLKPVKRRMLIDRHRKMQRSAR